MKKILIALAVVSLLFISAKREYNPTVPKFYNSSGQITTPTRIWDGIITPTTGAGQTIDISSAGFSSINSITLTPANNTGTVTSMPFVSIKSYSTTQVTINILQSNNQTVSVLGTIITPLITATPLTGITIHCHVAGW